MRSIIRYVVFVSLIFRSISAGQNNRSVASGSPDRPDLVLNAIENNSKIYYVGIGSNMSRTKLENRSICGSKIKILSMEPCVIKDHRLAFNMRGLPPLEPGMGSLEPLSRENSKALLSYENEECHGALILLSAEDYEKVYKSEGGGSGKRQGYEEIVVTAAPYNSKRTPVQAVAFRVRDHQRMNKDACPSQRYMDILNEGAKELGLKPCYKKWLKDHPVQVTSPLVTMIAINNLFFTSLLSFRMKLRLFSSIQSWLVFTLAYVPSSETSAAKRAYGDFMTGLLLLPGAVPGIFIKYYQQATGTINPMMKAIMNRK